MKRQQGAVSIFVVMFAMLLFVAITVGFAVFMLRDQERATDNDLSRSAYDSAQAGIEDAKRVLAKYNDCVEQRKSGTPDAGCTDVIAHVLSGSCGTVSQILRNKSEEEAVKINNEDGALEQAYTCVKIEPNTVDVVKDIKNVGDIKIVPLKGEKDFNTVKVSWMRRADLQGLKLNFTDKVKNDSLTPKGGPSKRNPHAQQLPVQRDWKKEWGSILRVQAIQYSADDVNVKKMDNDARTAFLYPYKPAAAAAAPVKDGIDLSAIDKHRTYDLNDPANDLDAAYNRPVDAQHIHCDPDGTSEYVCHAYIKLQSQDKTSYLTLAGAYVIDNKLGVKVELLNRAPGDASDGEQIKFSNVQPRVDVTGRANNVFRRVEARIEANPSEDALPLPRATLSIEGDFCKDYMISDTAEDYDAGTCQNIDTNVLKP